ncbi:hypothetical protein QYE76_022578 [Lolium multiflorum]|uniref:Gag-pol polyprotein n=1 Tax=Lolium multiflorum TaxID=4521 RepID=A0AAD8VTB5_LOLMU|nr:hypothetical protein QYE76_022578 [Lolium multiflorum]
MTDTASDELPQVRGGGRAGSGGMHASAGGALASLSPVSERAGRRANLRGHLRATRFQAPSERDRLARSASDRTPGGGYYLMSCIKDVPTLSGDNYTEWRKKVDFAFVCAEVDWVLDTPQPIKPADPVSDYKDDDDAWDRNKKDHAPVKMAYTLEKRKWQTGNKKCMAFIKNTIENAIVGSIAECAFAGEYLEKIKSQSTGSSKTYATQLLKQLVTEKYTRGAHGIREHILRMSNLAAKLKPMDDDLELKPALLVHLVMAALPSKFDNFVVNYNMNPEKWDIEKTIAMCVQEEDRLKAQNGAPGVTPPMTTMSENSEPVRQEPNEPFVEDEREQQQPPQEAEPQVKDQNAPENEAPIRYEEGASIARGGEVQLDKKLDVKLDMELAMKLDMKTSHGSAREERDACAREEDEVQAIARPGPTGRQTGRARRRPDPQPVPTRYYPVCLDP